MLVITKYIARHEFGPLERVLTIDDLRAGARKIVKGLAIEMRVPARGREFRFFKVRAGKRDVARMIVLLKTENGKAVPILIRLKQDKMFGMNMAMNNPDVVRQINNNLDHVIEDLRAKRFEEFPL
jgi:hypothetical protein